MDLFTFIGTAINLSHVKKESIFKNYKKGCFIKHEEYLNFY